jgi:midasin (ATPase involved in ribosome maturation)
MIEDLAISISHWLAKSLVSRIACPQRASIESGSYIKRCQLCLLIFVLFKLMFTIRHSIPCLSVPLQGPSSAGKAPLVDFLAQLTGEKLEKINNNEHADFFEYIGGDVLTPVGTLEFRGPVVQPARSGEWIALDELNLAPPDVLEEP